MKVALHVLPLTVVLLVLPAAAGAQSATELPADLGDVVVGTRSPVVYVPVTVTAAPPGGLAFAGAPPQPTGPDAAQFTLPANTCAGATLPAGASCFVGVRFAPTSTGPKTASVVLTDAAAALIATLPLSGTGVAPPGAGAQGPPGPPGPGGAPGPQGIPGLAIQATCTTKGKRPKTRCRIVILPADVAATAIRVRLVRAGKTVARGSARREGLVRLRALRRVRPGRYTVAVSFVADGRRVSGRQVVRVR